MRVPFRPSDVWVLALCFASIAGLVEGAGLLLYQKIGWLNWLMTQMAVSIEILWISPVVNAVLFLAAGIPLALLAWLRRDSRQVAGAAFAFFGFLTFFDWVYLNGKLKLSGAIPLAMGFTAVLVRTMLKRPDPMRLWRRCLPWAVGAALAALLVIEGGGWLRERVAMARLPAAPADAPNILIIVLDTLRADHLSHDGYPRKTSPNLDQLAQRGLRFRSAIAPSSWTLPVHASLLTGQYQFEHGAGRDVWSGAQRSLPQVLAERGYRTAAVSANTHYFGRREGFGAHFHRFYDYFHSLEDMFLRTFYGRKIEQFVLSHMGVEDYPSRKLAPEVNQQALGWLARDTDKPFFLVLNYFDTHDPYVPPQPWRSMFSTQKNPGGIINGKQLRVAPKLTPEQLQGEIDAYDGAIAFVDDAVGKLLAEMEKRGLLRNTIVVVTSDHGESLGEHGLFFHRNALYRELIRVPLIFVWPGKLPEGKVVDVPVTLASVPATLMEMTGMPQETGFHAPSLQALWEGEGEVANWPAIVAELEQFHYDAVKTFPTYHGRMKSLVTRQWQYIFHEVLGTELYDWEHDLQQNHNMAETAEGRVVVEELARELRERVKHDAAAPR